jgi:hypothetical protein
MDAGTRKIIVFSVFAGSLIFGYLNFRDKFGPAPAETATPSIQPLPAQAAQKSRLIDIEKYSQMGWGRDPFVDKAPNLSISSLQADEPSWVLGGILYDENNPVAIINGQIVRPGESIAGAKVIAIDRKKVALEINGGSLSLSLSGDES